MYVYLDLIWPTITKFHSYIANLDPHYIFALTETASFHQVSVLRDAIFRHLAMNTSIRVKVPVSILESQWLVW
jgi:hypothetical protein